jgi:hypothetical protein
MSGLGRLPTTRFWGCFSIMELPWESEVAVTDGTSCGFPAPTREYQLQSAQTEATERRKYA